MGFKDSFPEFRKIDIALIDPDPAHPRKRGDDANLKALANSIQNKGLIQPLLVQPADAQGRYRLIVGERRWRAAQLAGESQVAVLVHPCPADECLEIQVFENLGLGVRQPLEARDMAAAIQQIAGRFADNEAAAEHFGRKEAWLNQATAAAKLSPKVVALLDAGKISGTGTAIGLEKLARNDEAKAELLIERIEQLPEGEKLPKTVVDRALSEAGLRRSKKNRETEAPPPEPPGDAPTSRPLPAAASAAPGDPGRRVSSGKLRQVAEILGLSDGDEDTVLARLVDEFLAMKGENGAAF